MNVELSKLELYTLAISLPQHPNFWVRKDLLQLHNKISSAILQDEEFPRLREEWIDRVREKIDEILEGGSNDDN